MPRNELENIIYQEIDFMEAKSLNEVMLIGPDLVDPEHLYAEAQLILHANGDDTYKTLPGEILFPQEGLIPFGTSVRLIRKTPNKKPTKVEDLR